VNSKQTQPTETGSKPLQRLEAIPDKDFNSARFRRKKEVFPLPDLKIVLGRPCAVRRMQLRERPRPTTVKVSLLFARAPDASQGKQTVKPDVDRPFALLEQPRRFRTYLRKGLEGSALKPAGG